MKKYQQGFTLIELMIVIAILGILIAIAIPAYQDYSIRAKVSECANLLAPAKTGFAEYRSAKTSFPTTMAAAGVDTQASTYCNAPTVATSSATAVALNIVAPATKTGGSGDVTLVLTGTRNATSGDIQWACTSSGVTKYAPGSCR
jgi:prepilin-type N-terminal cleavage/methylation domain-containing protein